MLNRSCFQLCMALCASIAYAIVLPGEAAVGETAAATSQPVLVALSNEMQFIGGPGTPRVVFSNAFAIPVPAGLAPSHLHYARGAGSEFGFEPSDGQAIYCVQFYAMNESSGPVSQEALQAAAIDQANMRWHEFLAAGTAEVEKSSKYLVELHYRTYLHHGTVPVIDRYERVDKDLMRVSVVPMVWTLTPDQFAAMHAGAEPMVARLLHSATALAPQKGTAASAKSAVSESGYAHDAPAPAWGASDPAKWPNAVMYNDGVLTGNMGIGGSGFLFRLPGKTVVAGTALHVFGKDTKLDALGRMIKSWTMVAPVSQKKLRIGALAMKVDPANPVDCVIASVSQSEDYPAVVLTPRQSPLAVDEVVYVPGITVGSGDKATYHKAKVVFLYDAPARVDYIFDQQIDTNGFSGAPILDSHGLLVGIHQGHSSTSDGRKDWYGIPITAAIASAKAPAARAVETVAGSSANDASATASRAFDMAQNYIIAGKYDVARSKLQDIISSYPNTPAAKKAKTTLVEIAGE